MGRKLMWEMRGSWKRQRRNFKMKRMRKRRTTIRGVTERAKGKEVILTRKMNMATTAAIEKERRRRRRRRKKKKKKTQGMTKAIQEKIHESTNPCIQGFTFAE